jgi:hypothetical protein
MKYIEYSIQQINEHIKEDKKKNIPTVIRIETTSGSPEPRLVRVVEVGDDYILGRGRNKTEPEIFSLNHIASWRFAPFVVSEWKW